MRYEAKEAEMGRTDMITDSSFILYLDENTTEA